MFLDFTPTAGFPVDCSSRLLQYSACRGPFFVPRPVLERFDQASDRSPVENLITGKTLVHFLCFLFLAVYVRFQALKSRSELVYTGT